MLPKKQSSKVVFGLSLVTAVCLAYFLLDYFFRR